MSDNSSDKGSDSFLSYKGLLNFRDLGVSSADNAENKRYIKEGTIFRSATLDNLNENDVQDFIQQHNIRTIIDLRTSRECRGEAAIDKSFPTTVVESMRPSELLSLEQSHPEVVHQEVDPAAKTVLRKKYRIALTGRNFERNAVFMSCTLRQKSLLIWYLLSCQHDRAALLVGREVLAPMGVANMYKQFLAHCNDEILETLLLFTNPDNYPIQIHCTQGKDRTGLISCLLLSMAGVPEDIIVKDYAKTQAGLAPIRKDMINDLKRVGLSEEFADAPPKNMRELLDYLDATYGSVKGYLESIGFNAALQERVRSIIAETN
ncbi:tyrosine serine protein [Lichtheimia corymbifera JMRC:FSU:9682]|uniref:Tyrosine serine protein n=1 Tax=Lichtheimia corymbifera JMRC:FSU:9682 TaxID=1263082 RepID=A0A068SB91_9FUNG|nr:tyrosine serine protein [Lichtheimia corymbifera JMRC:FSU:9682]